MPIWMIMMGLQVIFFIVSGLWVILWMRGKPDIYDQKLEEMEEKYRQALKARQMAGNASSVSSLPTNEGQSK